MVVDKHARGLLAIARRHYQQQEYAQARHYLEEIIETHANYADVHHMLGVILHQVGLFSKAQAAFEKALQLNPRYTEAALSLAILYNDIGKYSEAQKVFTQAAIVCAKEPNSLDPFVAGKIANLHATTAEAYRSAGLLPQALVEYQKAVSIRPAFADLRTGMARVLMDLHHYAQASTELEQALRDKPNFVTAQLSLGMCYTAQNKHPEAKNVWQAIFSTRPQEPNAPPFTFVPPTPQTHLTKTRTNMPKFVFNFIAGKYKGGSYEVAADGEISIGRGPETQIILVEDMVSRRHARIVSQDGTLTITDLGSTNGTFVNSARVQFAALKDGDRVAIGTTLFVVNEVSNRDAIPVADQQPSDSPDSNDDVLEQTSDSPDSNDDVLEDDAVADSNGSNDGNGRDDSNDTDDSAVQEAPVESLADSGPNEFGEEPGPEAEQEFEQQPIAPRRHAAEPEPQTKAVTHHPPGSGWFCSL